MKIAHDTVVMVADGEKLLLFRNEGDEAYPVLETIAHEETWHPPTREQGSDQPGRSFSSIGSRRSSLGQTDWHDQDEQRFASHAAQLLDRVTSKSQADVVLIAAPRFLGEMRKHLPDHLAKRIVAQVAKDLVHHQTDDVVDVIVAHEA